MSAIEVGVTPLLYNVLLQFVHTPFPYLGVHPHCSLVPLWLLPNCYSCHLTLPFKPLLVPSHLYSIRLSAISMTSGQKGK